MMTESNSYDSYRDVRDEAWRVLAENGICKLPVDLQVILQSEGIEAYSYTHAQVLIESLHLQARCKSGGYVVLAPDGRRIVLYDDVVPIEFRRFLIACGIGHFVLGHVDKNEKTDNMLSVFNEEDELRAGIFAGRLLAPLSVLWAMGVHNAQEIRRVCIVPQQTAAKRFERLKEINERNLDRGLRTGQGTMFLSGYERAAFRNFSAFTEEYRFLNNY